MGRFGAAAIDHGDPGTPHCKAGAPATAGHGTALGGARGRAALRAAKQPPRLPYNSRAVA